MAWDEIYEIILFSFVHRRRLTPVESLLSLFSADVSLFFLCRVTPRLPLGGPGVSLDVILGIWVFGGFFYPFVVLREGGGVSIMVYVRGNHFRLNIIFLDL